MERKNTLMVFTLASILIFGLIAPSFTFEPAFASDVLWAIERSSPIIHNISPADGSIISSPTITLATFTVTGGTGLATDPTTGVFWALLKVTSSSDRILVTIVPSTGVATLVGDTGDKFAGLAFLADGTLQGVVGDGASSTSTPNPETLFTLNKLTAAPTLVCALGNGDDGENIAFNPSTGLVGHFSGKDLLGQIFETIDDGVCNTTNVPLSGAFLNDEPTGLTYSTAEGLFLVTTRGTPGFYSLTNGGVATLRGPTLDAGGSSVPYKGLAFNVDLSGPDPIENDHYLGYKVKETKHTDKFEKITVILIDQFERDPTTYIVEKPERLYNPVDKNGEGISDEITHLLGYKIKAPKGTDKFEKVTNVLVENQFGEIIVDVKKPKLLLVPSSKDLTSIPDPLNPITVDHYKCYDVKESKDTPKFVKRLVTLSDPNFGETKIFEVKKPKQLCTPVDKNAEGIIDPVNHLMCYDLKKIKDEPKFKKTNVFTNNQFEPEDLEVKKEHQLCVPSIKTLP